MESWQHEPDATSLFPQADGYLGLSAAAMEVHPSNTLDPMNDARYEIRSEMQDFEEDEEDEKDRPPRPPNSWILYRSSKSKEIRAQLEADPNAPPVSSRERQAEISRLVSHMWKHESSEVKEHFAALAEEKRIDHRQKYPNYRYRPRKESSTVDSSIADDFPSVPSPFLPPHEPLFSPHGEASSAGPSRRRGSSTSRSRRMNVPPSHGHGRGASDPSGYITTPIPLRLPASSSNQGRGHSISQSAPSHSPSDGPWPSWVPEFLRQTYATEDSSRSHREGGPRHRRSSTMIATESTTPRTRDLLIGAGQQSRQTVNPALTQQALSRTESQRWSLPAFFTVPWRAEGADDMDIVSTNFPSSDATFLPAPPPRRLTAASLATQESLLHEAQQIQSREIEGFGHRGGYVLSNLPHPADDDHLLQMTLASAFPTQQSRTPSRPHAVRSISDNLQSLAYAQQTSNAAAAANAYRAASHGFPESLDLAEFHMLDPRSSPSHE